MSLISDDLTKFGSYLKKEFKVFRTDFLPLAVTLTQAVKKVEDSGVLDTIANLLASETNGLSVQLNEAAKTLIAKALAVELALEAVPDNATPEQLGAADTAITTAITGLAPKPKSQFFSNLGVTILNIFNRLTGQSESPTYAEDVIAIQNTYLKLKAQLDAEPIAGNAVIESGKANVNAGIE